MASPVLIPKEKSLEGRTLSQKIQDDLKKKIQALKPGSVVPNLQVILVGDDPASDIYTTRKREACERAGFRAHNHRLPESTSAQQLSEKIHELNEDPKVHGILLQLPLPKHLNPDHFLNQIKTQKDVDGFHTHNVGRLWGGFLERTHVPCTAIGILKLLQHHSIEVKGQHCVIVGQSSIVGKPTSALLLKNHATVSLCHRHSVPLERYTRDADILIVATGVKHLIEAKHIKDGVCIVDVGIHRDGTTIVGDVNASSVLPKVRALTPVPGGVGPMTIACLLENTWNAYESITQNSSL